MRVFWRGMFVGSALFFTATAVAMAGVKCSCPSVKADGEGNSSCSASESGDRCTIDYNMFGEREVAAYQALESLGIKASSPKPGLNTIMALEGAEGEGELVEAVLLYLTVAAVDQYNNDAILGRDSTINIKELYAVEKLVQSQKGQIWTAFSRSNAEKFRSMDRSEITNGVVGSQDIGSGTLSPGCIEIQAENLWVMFKTFWSPARFFPGCGFPN
ncbi:hypothetical protein [Hwanghaeella sp.]|uniref:hypothetical protein n=1 Tax=Hwanghaeella sp. TaxID=2605943 RepID=UPI003CCB8999